MQVIAAAVAAGQWPPANSAGLQTREVSSNVANSKGTTIIPEPEFDLVRNWMDYLNPDVALATRTINYVASEGCARYCTFCSEPVISNRSWSPHNVSRSIRSIRHLCDRSDANGLKFHDANFFHDRSRAIIFAECLKAQIGLPWAATIHPADLIQFSQSELHHISSCGLSRLLVGLESPSREITKLAGKQYDPATAPELAIRLANAGIRGMFTYIVGWPGASPEHYSQTIEAAEQMQAIWVEHQAKIHFLEPWPGTAIFRLLKRQGFNEPRGLNEWAEIDYYQAKYLELHDPSQLDSIKRANIRLSPYVDA